MLDVSQRHLGVWTSRIHPTFFMQPPKTLIRLGGCPEYPESSLGENSKWFVLSCLRYYYIVIFLNFRFFIKCRE